MNSFVFDFKNIFHYKRCIFGILISCFSIVLLIMGSILFTCAIICKNQNSCSDKTNIALLISGCILAIFGISFLLIEGLLFIFIKCRNNNREETNSDIFE